MEALIVVESCFGNTRAIADAIGDGMGGAATARVREVAEAPGSLDGVDLLVVGGPTHAFSMTRPSTRRSAAERAGSSVATDAPGVREWIAALPPGAGRAVATFDTRSSRPRLPGSAAVAAARAMRRNGYRPIAAPKTFWVTGMEGPLADGEVDRALAWGATLANLLVDRARGARS